MTVTYRCGDHAALVGYLYDDCEPGESAAIAAHLAECPACTTELASLQFTRDGLQAWSPPEVALGFKLIQEQSEERTVPEVQHGPSVLPGNVLRPSRWWTRPLPAWAQAAAAVALFAAGAALGTMRAGGLSPVTSGVAGSVAPGQGSATAAQAPDLAAVEQRLREQLREELRADMETRMAQVQATPVSAPGSAPASAAAAAQGLGPAARIPADQAALIQQVKALIQQSEQRQQRELALRTAEVVRDIDSQRRGDLARIERTFGQMEGNTGVQVEQQRQMLNYLMRVSQRQPQ